MITFQLLVQVLILLDYLKVEFKHKTFAIAFSAIHT